MNKVMVINSRDDYGCDVAPFPPVGAIGEIVSDLDEYDEYDVIFHGHHHPSIDPSWITHKSMIVFINEDKEKLNEKERCIV